MEGYTDFLWTVFMAGVHLLPSPVSKISLVVMLAGVAHSLLANLQVVKKIGENLVGANNGVVLAGVVLTAFYYPLIYWTLRGMEVGILRLLTTWPFYARSGLGPILAQGCGGGCAGADGGPS